MAGILSADDWFPEPYIPLLTGLGFLVALVARLPLVPKRLPLCLPIVCIASGAAVFSLPGVTSQPLPFRHPDVTERFCEFVVIAALMGAGLKLDRVFELRCWSVTWRLLGIAILDGRQSPAMQMQPLMRGLPAE